MRDFRPKTRMGKYVHKLFMIECLTGARMSDCMRISSANIDDSGNTLTYVSKKSKIEVTVPIHKWLRPFLVPSDYNEPREVSFTTAVTAYRLTGAATPIWSQIYTARCVRRSS